MHPRPLIILFLFFFFAFLLLASGKLRKLGGLPHSQPHTQRILYLRSTVRIQDLHTNLTDTQKGSRISLAILGLSYDVGRCAHARTHHLSARHPSSSPHTPLSQLLHFPTELSIERKRNELKKPHPRWFPFTELQSRLFSLSGCRQGRASALEASLASGVGSHRSLKCLGAKFNSRYAQPA